MRAPPARTVWGSPRWSGLGFSDPGPRPPRYGHELGKLPERPQPHGRTTGFAHPNFSVNTLAQSVAAGQTVGNLGLNSGLTNFNGAGLGNGLFVQRARVRQRGKSGR